MSPKLYMIRPSPAVRSVLMAAKALNVELEEIVVNVLQGDHLKEEYLQLNPLHTVPTLVDDDGFVLFDSHAILGYLVHKYGENDDLYPKDNVNVKALIDQRLHFDSSVLFARGLIISRSILMENAKEISDYNIEKLQEAYEFLEKLLEGNEFAVGDDLTIADFCLVSTVTSWDILVPIDEEKFPNIKNWIKKLQEFEFYQENQKGLDEYRNLVIGKLAS